MLAAGGAQARHQSGSTKLAYGMKKHQPIKSEPTSQVISHLTDLSNKELSLSQFSHL